MAWRARRTIGPGICALAAVIWPTASIAQTTQPSLEDLYPAPVVAPHREDAPTAPAAPTNAPTPPVRAEAPYPTPRAATPARALPGAERPRQRRDLFIDAGLMFMFSGRPLLDQVSVRIEGSGLMPGLGGGVRWTLGAHVALEVRGTVAGPFRFIYAATPIICGPDGIVVSASHARFAYEFDQGTGTGTGAVVMAEGNLVLRPFSRGPWYLGVGVAAGLLIFGGTTSATVQCPDFMTGGVGREGTASTGLSMVPAVGLSTQTGLRFGPRDAFDLSLRIKPVFLASSDISGTTIVQLSLGWALP